MTETSRMADTLYEKAIGLISVNDVDGAIRLAELNLELVFSNIKFCMHYCDWLIDANRPGAAADILYELHKGSSAPHDLLKRKMLFAMNLAGRGAEAIGILWSEWEKNLENTDLLNEILEASSFGTKSDNFRNLEAFVRVIDGELDTQNSNFTRRISPNNTDYIALLAPNPRARSWKIAEAIKDFGGEVLYIHPDSFEPDPDNYFDVTISYSSFRDLNSTILQLEAESRPKLYHVFCDGFGYVEATMLMTHVARPVVFDYYDLIKTTYIAERAKEYEFSRSLERWCIENSDGICARNLEIRVAKRQGLKLKNNNNIFFPEYCYDSICRRTKIGDADGRLHIYISENISEPGNDLNAPNSLRPLIELFEGNDKFRIYLYPSQKHKENLKIFPGYAKLADQQENFVLRPNMSEKMFLEEVSQFDVLATAFHTLNPDYQNYTKVTRQNRLICYSNRFADCLDTNTFCCIARWVNEPVQEQNLMFWLMNRYGVGLAPAGEDASKIEFWESLRQSLRSKPLDLSEARQKWSIDAQKNRLKLFYERCLVQSKKHR